MKKIIACASACCIALLFSQPCFAQAWPSKPVRIVIPFASGGPTDIIARLVGQKLNEILGQPMVVESRAGAGGNIGTASVAKSAPDGYTVLLTSSAYAVNVSLSADPGYNPDRDFLPAVVICKQANLIFVHPSLPAKNLAEFIELAKRQPGKLTFGSGGATTLVAAEQFAEKAGIKMTHVPYKSNPLALNDLLGGQIDMLITDTATGLPQIKAGKVRALGVTTRTRSSLTPDVPTLQEGGLKDYELTFWFAAYSPAGTPPAITQKLNELFVKAAKMPASEAFHKSVGTEAITTTPEGLVKFQVAEAQKWKQMIKRAGIQPE